MAKVITLRLDTENGTYLCDTYKDSSIQITKRVQSIDTLNTSQGVVTQQTFRVPLDGNLIDALGDLTELQIAPKVDIRKSIKGSILVDGYPRFTGSFQVIKISKDENKNLKEVELIFKGSETDLKAELTSIKLSDLLVGEFLDYKMSEIYQYITDTDNYISDNGYSWALIDYGQAFAEDGSGKRIYDVDNPLTQLDFKPQIFMRKIFEKLPIPITVDSSAADLLKQVIPLHNNDKQTAVLDTSPTDFNGYLSRTSDQSWNVPLSGINLINVPFTFNNYYQYNNSIFDLANNKIQIPTNGVYSFDIKLKTTVRSLGSDDWINYTLTMRRVSDNVVFARARNGISVNSVLKESNITYSFENKLYAGQEYYLKLEVYSSFSSSTNTMQIVIKPDTKFELTAAPAIRPESKVDVSENVPELTAWDCVRTIITQCNGVLETNENGYNIKPWVKWVEEGSFFNLDDRIDSSKDLQIEPTNVTGAKSILLTYQEDGDVLNKIYKDLFDKTYGNLYIADTGTDFTKEEFKIDIPFAATPMTYVKDTSVIIPKFINDGLKTVKTKPRLLFHSDFSPLGSNRMGSAIPLKDIFLATDYSTQIGFPFIGHWENINGGYNTRDYNFGTTINFFASSGFPNNTLYERFWKQYIAETYGPKSRKIKLSLRISQNDFDNLKMNEQIFYKGSYLRFLSINNLDIINEEFTECELVFRVTQENIDIAPYYPYDIINQIVQFKDSSDNTVVSFPDAGDLQESCEAYGYFYDANLNQCVQRGNIIQI